MLKRKRLDIATMLSDIDNVLQGYHVDGENRSTDIRQDLHRFDDKETPHGTIIKTFSFVGSDGTETIVRHIDPFSLLSSGMP